MLRALYREPIVVLEEPEKVQPRSDKLILIVNINDCLRNNATDRRDEILESVISALLPATKWPDINADLGPIYALANDARLPGAWPLAWKMKSLENEALRGIS